MDFDADLRGFSGTCRLFPLPGVVLFPHAVLPLHIFEPRYRQMTEDALAGDRLVTIVRSLPDPDALDPGEPAIEAVACLGKILNHQRLADGRFNFLLLGCRRVRLIRELGAPTLYRQAEAELLEDREPTEPTGPRRDDLVAAFRALASAGQGAAIDPDLDALLESGLPLGPLTDILAHSLGLPPAMKQGLLAECRVDRRADGLIAILHSLAAGAPSAATGRRSFPPPFSTN